MSEVRRHVEAEDTLVAEQTPGTALPRAPGNFGVLSRRVRNAVAAALLVVSPAYWSCAAQVDTEDSVPGHGGESGSTPEQIDYQTRMVSLSGNRGSEWRFQGNYPKDFKLVVSVDGKVINAQIVTVDPTVDPSTQEQFYVEGPLGSDAQNVHVQTFDLDGNEIPIHYDAKKNGMIGNPDLPVGLE